MMLRRKDVVNQNFYITAKMWSDRVSRSFPKTEPKEAISALRGS